MINWQDDQAVAYLYQQIMKKVKKDMDLMIAQIRAEAKVENQIAVGDYFMTSRTGNPEVLLGYGKWEQIKDRFPLAAGDSYDLGDTGGEAEVTLTLTETARHKHVVYQARNECPGSKFAVVTNYAAGGGNSVFALANAAYISDAQPGDGDVSGLVNADYAGGGQPHNNMPPYFTLNIWLRIE